MKASDINPKKNPAFSKRLYNWCKREGGELYIFHNVDSGKIESVIEPRNLTFRRLTF
jgi:hypothetical protein